MTSLQGHVEAEPPGGGGSSLCPTGKALSAEHSLQLELQLPDSPSFHTDEDVALCPAGQQAAGTGH